MNSLKVFLVSFGLVLAVFTVGLVALAQEALPTEKTTGVGSGYSSSIVNLDEDIQPEDLGVSEPKVLPNSPFYFLKNWARGIQNLVTINPVKKAELRMKFANEKLMEVKKITQKTQNPEIIKKATENYQQEIERIKNQAEKIKEKAKENPQVESFLDKFIHQQTLHEKLLQKLETQVPPQAFEKIKEAREEHLENFQAVMLKLEDRREKITEKLDKILEEQKGSQFKEFKNLEVLKNLEEKVPKEAKEAIKQAEENAAKRLQSNLEKMSPEDQDKFKEYTEKISGEKEKHLEILENLKAKIKEVPETSRTTQLMKKLEEGKAKIFEKIEKKIERLDCPVWSLPAPGFCKEGRIIIKKDENDCPLPPRCIILGEELTGLVTCCMDSACVRVTKEKCINAGGKIVGASSCVPNPCERKVELPSEKPAPEKPTELPKPTESIACITLWDPVCGKNGKTYSNSCFAKSAGVEIDYEGVCKETSPLPELKITPEKPKEMAEGCCVPCDGVCNLESVVGCQRAIKNGICTGWQTACPCP